MRKKREIEIYGNRKTSILIRSAAGTVQNAITRFHKPPNQLQSYLCLNLFIWTPPIALVILYFIG